MKTSSKLYLFFTSLMFLFAPLSIGLAAIYFEFDEDKIHLPGLLVNVILLLILVGVIGALIKKKKLLMPNLLEKKYLLFGLLSNIVMYFYVFQYSLVIEEFISVYITVVLILLLYFVIISKKPIIYELWILGIWFFILDTIHYQFIYSTTDFPLIGSIVDVNFFQHIFYLTIPLLALGLFLYHMYKYKVIDVFTSIASVILVLTIVVFFEGIDMQSKYMLTLNLVLPFVILTDLITMLIYKRFNTLKIPFYMRLYTLLVLIIYYGEEGLFQSNTYSRQGLYEMVAIIYVAIVCNLIVYLLPHKEALVEALEDDSELAEVTIETLLSIDLDALTLTTLKALAKVKNIKGYTSLKKDEIIKLLK